MALSNVWTCLPSILQTEAGWHHMMFLSDSLKFLQIKKSSVKQQALIKRGKNSREGLPVLCGVVGWLILELVCLLWRTEPHSGLRLTCSTAEGNTSPPSQVALCAFTDITWIVFTFLVAPLFWHPFTLFHFFPFWINFGFESSMFPSTPPTDTAHTTKTLRRSRG